MPHYRVILAENVRRYHTHVRIEAESPEAAVEIARTKGEWTDSENGETADAQEPEYIAEECDEAGNPTGAETPVLEPGFVYKDELEKFVAILADSKHNEILLLTDDGPLTLFAIRERARKILGRPSEIPVEVARVWPS